MKYNMLLCMFGLAGFFGVVMHQMNKPQNFQLNDNGWKNCERPPCLPYELCVPGSSLPCCSEILHAYLVDMNSILTEAKIDYFIMWGTLIGAMRDNDIIPWETDIDIVVNNYDFFLTQRSTLEKHGYIFFNDGLGRICKKSNIIHSNKLPSAKNNWFPYVDVYVVWKLSFNRGIIQENIFKMNHLVPLGTCTIRNISYSCPAAPEKVLNEYYGKNWMKPNIKHLKWRANAVKLT